MVGMTYSESNRAHDGHGEDIQPSMLQPLAEGRPRRHTVRLMPARMRLAGQSVIASRRLAIAVEEAHLSGGGVRQRRPTKLTAMLKVNGL